MNMQLSVSRRVALAAGSSLFISIALLFYSTRHSLGSLYSIYVPHEDSCSSCGAPLSSDSVFTSTMTPPKSTWDPQQKYLVYLPFEGISNQFFAFQNAALLAKRLNRTLVVPPITSNRHDRLGTNQPWSHYMDLEHMASHSGIKMVEWHTIKPIDQAARQIIEAGNRTNFPLAWRAMAEPFPCQVVRNFGHEHFVGEEDSIGADFAYQYMLDLKPIPIPGFQLDSNVDFAGDIVDSNQNSTSTVVCLTFTFTAQFERGKNRWDIAFSEAGHYARFLPRFASYVEDLISYRFGLLNGIHPHPPMDLGSSILDIGEQSETFLERKPESKDYIAIHLRRGDIEIKCLNSTKTDCIVPVSIYKKHVDAILALLPEGTEKPNVVLVSDTKSEEEKQEIDSYGWYRLDHAVDQNLLDASQVLGPFSPAIIDSAVLTGRGARWMIGSRRSTMSWLAAMRLLSWYNETIIYPKEAPQQKQNQKRSQDDDDEGDDDVVTWDRSEQLYYDQLVL
ncbi:hypothetical protein BGZ93_007036 [Podila epicladia]|nr:hypothetical protein BGZ92_007566 [Podila epicladia]KAG0094581.1 hypothetical protein BGZ93_007036 [Podila epicladia]